MADFPGTKDAATIGYALLDELIDTLVHKKVISETDVREMRAAAVNRLEGSGKPDAVVSATVARRLFG
jgi:hypothetical protein